MNRSGTFVTKSGVEFKWEATELAGRGAVTGKFTSRPSPSDVQEAKAFMQGQAPRDSVGEFGAGDDKAARARVADYLAGGSRN